ncbi:hypothetical protein EBZ37_10805, partial [bacterium]|nr:hypothetical protein [bacterium]
MMGKRLVVIGDGWAALAALVQAIEKQSNDSSIFWVPGSGGRVLSAAPSVEGESGALAIEHMAKLLNVDIGARASGTSFIREFRNKSFREPVWLKGIEIADQQQRRAAELWRAESTLVPACEVRWSKSLVEIEEEFRASLMNHPAIQRREGVPVEGFELVGNKATALIFGSGERLEADHFVYADRWSRLGQLSGLPKNLTWNRSRDPMGVLQVIFSHHESIRPEIQEAFFSAMNRDSGDNEDRHVVGHFYRDGRESIWSSIISSEEGEDNHAIAKKLRRMKQALDKMFSQSEWTSESFDRSIKNETVRYEESIVFGEGEAPV